MKIHDFISYDFEAVMLLWKSFGLIRLWNDPQKDVQRKVDGCTKSVSGEFFCCRYMRKIFLVR